MGRKKISTQNKQMRVGIDVINLKKDNKTLRMHTPTNNNEINDDYHE